MRVNLYRALLLISGGFAIAAERLAMPALTNVALFGAAILLIAVGCEALLTKQVQFILGGWAYAQGKETYRGLPAMLWGVLFLGLGLVAAAITLARWFAPATAAMIWARLEGTSAGAGLALAGLGLVVGLYGLIGLLSGRAGLDVGKLNVAQDLLDRAGGAILLLVGVTLAAWGVLLVTAPGVVHAVAVWLKATVLRWLTAS
jgi:hypothetical protein